jgi:tetratricopeptide (TPR) repeat protein
MEAAAKLAPQNAQLRAAAALARLEAQLDAHQDPAPSLKVLRTMELPPGGELEVRLRTAEVLSGAHLYAESVADYSEAAKLAPDRADIFFNLALAHYYNGEWDAALENAKRAKALEDTGSTESLLGDIHEKRGDALDAVHSYQAAVSLEPNVEQHRLTLAAELLRHQTFDAAIVVLEQAASLCTCGYCSGSLITSSIAPPTLYIRCWRQRDLTTTMVWQFVTLVKSLCWTRLRQIR